MGTASSQDVRIATTSMFRTHVRETTMTAMFVNLPVTDLERSKAFYTAIGFTINPRSPITTPPASSSRRTTATS